VYKIAGGSANEKTFHAINLWAIEPPGEQGDRVSSILMR
jgi:hypothetical protein